MPLKTVICRYGYDPLDRLASRSPLKSAMARLYYQNDKLVSEIQGAESLHIFRNQRQIIARQTVGSQLPVVVLAATDRQHSVLHSVTPDQHSAFAYTPHGHSPSADRRPGFNGEQIDPVTGRYLLGNGYRAYNPVLMRFNSPDSLSPFGKGGLNAYAYCVGDPVNRSDPSGHLSEEWKSALYIAAGLITAGLGLFSARPALRAVTRGVNLKRPIVPATGLPARTGPSHRPANLSERLTAVTAVGAVTAGALWGTAFVANTTDPDSDLAKGLRTAALVTSLLTLGTRFGGVALSRHSAKAAANVAAKRAFRSYVEATRPDTLKFITPLVSNLRSAQVAIRTGEVPVRTTHSLQSQSEYETTRL